MPRSRYDDDDSPPRRGGRVAEYEDVEIRAGKGRRHRPDFLDDDYRREESGPLVVREEEVIEERHRGGGDRERSRRRRRERDSFDDEDDTMSVRTEKTEKSRRPKSHERSRDVDAGLHIRGPRGGELDVNFERDDTRSHRHRSRDFLEDASVHVRGRHGGEFDLDFDREHDSRSSRKSRGGGEREVRETEEEIEFSKGREPERRRKHRDSDRDISREFEEEIVFRPKRQPREVVNEEWVYYPKPREPSPPAIARETEEWVFQPRRYEQPPSMAIDYRDDSINIREREGPRGGFEEEIRIHERSREPPSPPRGSTYEEIRISEREREREPPPKPRTEYDEEIRITQRDREREPLPKSRNEYDEEIRITQRDREERRPPPKPRSVYGEEIRISEREREGSRGGYREEDITIRERDRDRDRGPPRRSEELVIRRSSPSPTRTERSSRYKLDSSYERDSVGTVRGGEQNEIIIRKDERDDTRSRAGGEREEIVIRRNEREPSREREPIRAPPIHQEIITHHRHIDHGYEYRPSPPPPAPPAPPKEEEEIEIRRTENRDGRRYEDDLIIDRRRNEDLRPPASMRARASSVEARGPIRDRDRFDIVDVPGSERIRINGGGDSQEITWSRTNGVRRSEEPPTRKYVGVPPKEDKMWTEITKDLVIREALEDTGYDFEETKDFFYVMEYLRYEDVRRLVRRSDDLRSKRKERIRQLEWEQKMPTPPKSVAARSVAESSPPPRAISERSWDEERERIVEREYFGPTSQRGPVVSPPPPPSYDRRRPREFDETVVIRQR